LGKSPNLTEEYSVGRHLRISYAPRDASVVPSIGEVFLEQYTYVKNWFDFRGDLAIDLWMAPEVVDLEYMTCVPCSDGYMCAPGTRNGAHVVTFVSPLTSVRNTDTARFSATLAHEIAHCFASDISQAGSFSMKRRESLDLPMWLEEGLCQVIQSEVNPSLRAKWADEIERTTAWYPLEDLWNDLADCADGAKGYLQAHKEVSAIVERRGKSEIIGLLHLNRTHYVEWIALPREGRVSARARYVNDWRPEEVRRPTTQWTTGKKRNGPSHSLAPVCQILACIGRVRDLGACSGEATKDSFPEGNVGFLQTPVRIPVVFVAPAFARLPLDVRIKETGVPPGKTGTSFAWEQENGQRDVGRGRMNRPEWVKST
jgi:hypothetical protein